MTSAQLPLAMRWPAQQRFASFSSGDDGAAIELARRAATANDSPWVFFSGAPASGKTHLLIAACAAAGEAGRRAQYISLRKLPRQTVDTALATLGGADLLAIDDVDALSGARAAEQALFDLYNRSRMEKSTLLFAARQPPAQIGIGLPDLVSRLSSCAQALLKPLDDDARREVVRECAAVRGIELDKAALDWLFARTERDLASLITLLDRLDRESLAQKRRITVPFLRNLLALS